FESQMFGVIHKSMKSFNDYGGRFPTADQIIQNAVIWRCMKSGKVHLILPKLAAMFPKKYDRALADEVKLDVKVRRAVHRIKAKQIKANDCDAIDWLIAQNYFESSIFRKPLYRLPRDNAAEELGQHLKERITVDM